MTAAHDTQHPAHDSWNTGFGVVMLIVSLFTLLVWIPNDIKGGFIDINQMGRPEPGDAFFPVILASLILLLSAVQLAGALFSRKPQPLSGRVTLANLKFLFTFYTIVFAGLAVMYWLGPLVVDFLRSTGVIDKTYRQLADTPPYKYLGYATGGFLMTMGLIAWVEGAIRLRAVLTVIIVLALLILVLDILLYNIQLPPNADF